MIRTVITPHQADISIGDTSLHLPKKYVGKKIEVLLYAADEVTGEKTKKKTEKKTLEELGLLGALNLTNDEYNEWQQFAKNIRNEWDRGI